MLRRALARHNVLLAFALDWTHARRSTILGQTSLIRINRWKSFTRSAAFRPTSSNRSTA
ncbi:hypothetical protein RHIZ404_210469 [Rhizobium sp. EC-SD404]|nr:hypothetical protein RHIZ404_210469 [Rhizobium sp. EC-SD404]